jgi:hypothetical protein
MVILNAITESIGLEWWVIKITKVSSFVNLESFDELEYYNNKQEAIDRYNDILFNKQHYYASNPVQVDWVSMLNGCNNNITVED